LKIDISPYLSEKSLDFHEILYTAADFQLAARHVIKTEKVALGRLRVRQNVFLDATVFVCYVEGMKNPDFFTISRFISERNKIRP